MNFSELKLNPYLLDKISQRGLVTPTPIQEKTIPLALKRKDIIACARTGSGKTLAFLLPILNFLLNEMTTLQERRPAGPVALILVPTRELALQVHQEAAYFLQDTPLKSVAIFGGVDYEKQKDDLSKNPELLIATPGRLLDYLRSGAISLAYVSSVVLDEADRMLDMGFIKDVQEILQATKEGRHIQLFSATLDYNAIYSVWEYMTYPEEVMINPELIDHSKIEQKVLHLSKDEKLPYLIQYLEEMKAGPIIIFTNNKNFVPVLVQNLNYHGITAQGLSSLVNQKRRIRILEDFKEKKFLVLVATDVASRGLHIEDVALVINFDIPQDPETYVHRIGRTARAGKSGMALSICSELDYENLERLERYLKYKIVVMQPDERYLENLSFVRIVSPQSQKQAKRVVSSKQKERSFKLAKPRLHKQHPPQKKHKIPTQKVPMNSSGKKIATVPLARSLKTPQSFWQKILSFFGLASKRPLPISEKTRALLEREAKHIYATKGLTRKRQRNPSGKRRKK